MTAHELLVDLLGEAYDRPSWHGPNLKAALKGVGAKQAAWQPGRDRPSIWHIALHAAYWKHRVWVRVTGAGADEKFPRPGVDWPDPPRKADAALWRKDVLLLGQMHRRLMQALVGLSSEDLLEPGPGQKRPRIEHLVGIALHDTYHAGQIRTIRRLYEARRR